MECISKISMIKIVKEHMGSHYSHYLLWEIQLYTLIILELNIFLRKYWKSKILTFTYNIFRINGDESITCGFCCIAFIEFILARKTLSDYTNLISSNDYKKNGKIIYKYFKYQSDRRSKSRV